MKSQNKIVIYTYIIFTIITIFFGIFVIYEDQKIPKINNYISLTDSLTEISANYKFAIADKQLEFLEFMANQDEETIEDYLGTIETEKKIREQLKKKNKIMEELEKKDTKYLYHEHDDELSLAEIEEDVIKLNEKEITLFNQIKEMPEIDGEIKDMEEYHKFENLKLQKIKELDIIYDELELSEQIDEFIQDHKVINVRLREIQIKQRDTFELHLTILITLFTMLSIFGIYKFRKL